jgi:hypothetical protein
MSNSSKENVKMPKSIGEKYKKKAQKVLKNKEKQETPAKRRGRPPKAKEEEKQTASQMKKRGRPPKAKEMPKTKKEEMKTVEKKTTQQAKTKVTDEQLFGMYREIEKNMSNLRKQLKRRLKRKTA